MQKIILASQSPRRKSLLSEITDDFICISPDEEKNLLNEKFSYFLIEEVALQKAKSVFKKIENKNSVIISADTVVVLDDEILLKPKDEQDAINTLKKLSNKEHKVITAHAFKFNEYEKVISETTYVSFNKLSDEQISSYVKNKKPLDKAGAYGIQELPPNFVKEVKGSFSNVVGFSKNIVKNEIENILKQL